MREHEPPSPQHRRRLSAAAGNAKRHCPSTADAWKRVASYAGSLELRQLAVVSRGVFVVSAAGAWLLACAPQPPSSAPLPAPAAVPDTATPAGSRGRQLFIETGCGGCHTLDGVPGATGVAGPNLTNTTLRPTLAGESIPADRDTLVRWLLDPASVKPDASMPSVGLTPQEAQELADFLASLPNVTR